MTGLGVTPGDWTYEPHDPGFSATREEPGDPGYPATVETTIRGFDGEDHLVILAKVGVPQYQEFDEDARAFLEPEVIGDMDANARFMASAPSMYRALKAARSAMLDTEDALNWRGPWAGVFDAMDGALRRAEGEERFADHDGRAHRARENRMRDMRESEERGC